MVFAPSAPHASACKTDSAAALDDLLLDIVSSLQRKKVAAQRTWILVMAIGAKASHTSPCEIDSATSQIALLVEIVSSLQKNGRCTRQLHDFACAVAVCGAVALCCGAVAALLLRSAQEGIVILMSLDSSVAEAARAELKAIHEASPMHAAHKAILGVLTDELADSCTDQFADPGANQFADSSIDRVTKSFADGCSSSWHGSLWFFVTINENRIQIYSAWISYLLGFQL